MKKAIIFWFSEAEGGRGKPPAGEEYYPTKQSHHLLSSNAEFIICEGPHKVGAMVIR